MFSIYNGNKLKISNKRIRRKCPNSWKLNNMLLKNPWVKEEVQQKFLKCFKLNENDNTTYKKCEEHSLSTARRDIYSTKCLHKKK